MGDAVVVGELHGATHRREHGDRPVGRERAAEGDFLAQARPAQQLHDQERLATGVDVVVEDRDDVRMAEPGAGAALAQEPLGGLGPEVGRVHRLERHLVAEPDAAGAEHLTHAA